VLVLVPFAAALSALVAWTVARIAGGPLRSAMARVDVPWYERARLAWPLRRALGRTTFVLLLMVPVIAFAGTSRWSRVSSGWLWLLLLAVVFRSARFATRGFRWPGPRSTVTGKQAWKTLLFVALHYAPLPVILALPFFVGPRLDAVAWGALAVAAAIVALLSTPLLLRAFRLSRILVEPSPRLLAAVARAAERIGVAPPSALEADLPVANAFAVPSRCTLVVTRPALALLDDEELAAVCGHEICHLLEPRRTHLRRALAVVGLFPIAFCRPIAALFPRLLVGIPSTIGICLVSLFAAGGVARLIARREEERADEVAHARLGEGGAYLRALEKIHRDRRLPLLLARHPGRRPGLLRRMFAHDEHGSFAERVAALGGALPADLKPPSRRRYFAAVGASVVLLAPGLATGLMLVFDPPEEVLRSETLVELSLGLGNDDADALRRLADFRFERGAIDESKALQRAADQWTGRWRRVEPSDGGVNER
jgi:Zn-dependent protease with chaperone function